MGMVFPGCQSVKSLASQCIHKLDCWVTHQEASCWAGGYHYLDRQRDNASTRDIDLFKLLHGLLDGQSTGSSPKRTMGTWVRFDVFLHLIIKPTGHCIPAETDDAAAIVLDLCHQRIVYFVEPSCQLFCAALRTQCKHQGFCQWGKA